MSELHALEDDVGYRVEHHHMLVNGPRSRSASSGPAMRAPFRPTIGFRLEHDGAAATLVGDTIPCDGIDQLAAAGRSSKQFACSQRPSCHPGPKGLRQALAGRRQQERVMSPIAAPRSDPMITSVG